MKKTFPVRNYLLIPKVVSKINFQNGNIFENNCKVKRLTTDDDFRRFSEISILEINFLKNIPIFKFFGEENISCSKLPADSKSGLQN